MYQYLEAECYKYYIIFSSSRIGARVSRSITRNLEVLTYLLYGKFSTCTCDVLSIRTLWSEVYEVGRVIIILFNVLHVCNHLFDFLIAWHEFLSVPADMVFANPLGLPCELEK